MYDGAVTAMIIVFQKYFPLRPGTEPFRRYIVRALALGTVRSYFIRQENDGVRTAESLAMFANGKRPTHNSVEQAIITKELLEKITNFPDLPIPVSSTLQCIAALGPDSNLKGHAFTASGDSSKWKRDRGRRPILANLQSRKQ